MAETLLTIAENIAQELGIAAPASVVGSSDQQVLQILKCIQRSIKAVRDAHAWPECTREYTFSTVANQANYALPQDYDYSLTDTAWNAAEDQELIGGLTPREWQWEKNASAATGIHDQIRIKGAGRNQFYVTPTPSSAQGYVYEYQTKTCVKPTDWIASTSFGHATYAWYDEQVYYNSTGGTTGTTAPTHTSGSASDGGITWSAIGTAYESFLADTDEPILDQQAVELGAMYRYLNAKGLESGHIREQYENRLSNARADKMMARPISTTRTRASRPWPSIPRVLGS